MFKKESKFFKYFQQDFTEKYWKHFLYSQNQVRNISYSKISGKSVKQEENT